MTLETFFEKFDQFADAPDAVAKMRELVRHIAVTGKLVPQDPNDGDARKMIDRAMERRQQTIKTKSLRRKELDESADLFEHEDLPSSWCVERFANLVDPENTISYGVLVPGNDVQDGIPFVRAQDLCLSNHPARPNKTIAPEIEKPYARTRLTGGEILLCVVGSIGKLGVVPDSWAGANIARAVARIKPIPDVLRDYLLLVLQDKSVQNYFASTTRTLAQPTLNVGMIEQTPIPVPPLAEQKRIVAKVDELMALCDRLEAQQQERETRHAELARASLARFADAPTPANLSYLFHSSFIIHPSDLRKSILTLAVQGKLVPQDPNDKPAEEIVSRIETERPEETVAPVDEAELPWSLPSCWQWVRLGTIANIKHGYAFSSESFTSEPTRYVLTTPGSFYESGGFRDRGANTKYFKGEVPPAFILKARDLIIPMTEQAAGLLGSPAFIPDDGKTYLHNQRLGKMEFYSDEVSPEFVFCFFNSEFFRGELARTCTGMKVRHTSPKRVLKVPFPLPPLAEQRRIVAKVERLMALVDALETQLAASRATAANLLSALVAELTAG